jgi:hypothetical protein
MGQELSTQPAHKTIENAISELTGHRWPIVGGHEHVPSVPGLYAVYGASSAWADLGLTGVEVARPLYVGKAEDSFVSRDLRTHFASGRTGQSTVRRSFAALLHESLHLHGIPRNQENPGHFANFGLSPDDDSRLTSWMWNQLSLAVWPKSDDVVLREVEREVVRRLDPPLNIEHLPRASRRDLSTARHAMADEARRWAKERGLAQGGRRPDDSSTAQRPLSR